MKIQDISKQDLDKFSQDQNWMSLQQAVDHIHEWIESKNYPTAESWIAQVEKSFPELEELKEAKEKLRKSKTEHLQSKSENLEVKSEKLEKQVEKIESQFSSSEKLMASMSYVSFLALVPLILKKDSLLCQHHGKQWLIFAIMFFFLSNLSFMIPLTSWLSWLLIIVVAIYWWIQAYKWKLWKAPIASDFAKKLNI